MKRLKPEIDKHKKIDITIEISSLHNVNMKRYSIKAFKNWNQKVNVANQETINSF